MKVFNIVFILFFLGGKVSTQTYEFKPSKKDTINYCNNKGERKGKWILMGRHKPKTCYSNNQVVETGNYERNMKQGIWEEYSCNNLLKSKQVYVNGKVNGEVNLYNDNGKMSARGTFNIDHWVNDLELFDDNGRLLYLVNFDANGNRKQGTYYCYSKTKKDSNVIYRAIP